MRVHLARRLCKRSRAHNEDSGKNQVWMNLHRGFLSNSSVSAGLFSSSAPCYALSVTITNFLHAVLRRANDLRVASVTTAPAIRHNANAASPQVKLFVRVRTQPIR